MTRIHAQAACSRPRTALLGSLIALTTLYLLLAATPASAFQACPVTPLATDVPVCEPPQKDSKEPPNLGVLKRKAINYRCFGDYDRDVAALFRVAQEYVEAHTGDVSNPALVFDIDETTLSNWPVILDDDFAYIKGGPCDLGVSGPCGWDDWQQSALDQAIAPALQLFNSAMARKVTVFFITGRRDEGTMREATAANLRVAGYVGWKPENLIMQPKGPHLDTIVDFKAPARAAIEKNYVIIANIGDQMSDLDGGHAQMIFRVPNPFYFIP